MAGSNHKIRAFINGFIDRSDDELHNIKTWFDKINELDQVEWEEVTWLVDKICENRFRARAPVESSNSGSTPVSGILPAQI
jgi:hypothetical protein